MNENIVHLKKGNHHHSFFGDFFDDLMNFVLNLE